MAPSKNSSPISALAGGRTALSVNVNKVALLRNTRELGIPSVLHALTSGISSTMMFTNWPP
jgi:pyridoxine 5-phosphate synthase